MKMNTEVGMLCPSCQKNKVAEKAVDLKYVGTQFLCFPCTEGYQFMIKHELVGPEDPFNLPRMKKFITPDPCMSEAWHELVNRDSAIVTMVILFVHQALRLGN